MYRNPDILILDEATSALDSSTEQVIQRAFHRFRDSGKTMIVIAHRLSTIAAADTILVLKDGVLIEQGNMTSCWPRSQHIERCGRSSPYC
ncbi:hypothetical protein KUH03_11635 [Sphingobacterium sp. E70]|nr:hypothetical protein KUH03_11635 [Sphingobacterium sp. E70]